MASPIASSTMSNPAIEKYGWTAFPRSFDAMLSNVRTSDTSSVDINSVNVPNSDLARKVQEYAKKNLPEQVYNHSMRVYYYGKWSMSDKNGSGKGKQLSSFSPYSFLLGNYVKSER
jgi:hypothetical protein